MLIIQSLKEYHQMKINGIYIVVKRKGLRMINILRTNV